MTRPVLLIDDEPSYRDSVVQLFEGSEYRIVEAASPAEGIAKLDADPQLRVILLDLSFDNESGTVFLKLISGRSSEYRVIILTGHDELLLAHEAGAFDVFHYLPKAQESAAQSILFSVVQAFNDLEHSYLAQKTDCLLRAQERITKNDPIEDVLNLICECARHVADAYTCHIRVYDFKHGDYHLRGFAGPDKRLSSLFGQPKEKGDDFTGEVVRSREAKVYDNLQQRPDFLKFKSDALARSWEPDDLGDQVRTYFDRAASAYIAPISTGLYGNLVDAVLNVSSDRMDFFTKEKQSLVNEFVNQAALAVTKDWLQKKRIDAHQDYGAIGDMLAAISEATRGKQPLNAVYKIVTERIAKIVSPEIVSVFQYDEFTGLVKNMAEVRGGQRIDTPDEEYRSGQSLTGNVVSGEKTIHLPQPDDPNPMSPSDDPRYDKVNEKKYLEMIPSGELKHYLGVPIVVGGRVRGVLRALNKKSQYYDEEPPIGSRRCLLERGFSQDCKNALEIAANHLAAAIHNVDLLEEKDRQVAQLRVLGEVGRLITSKMDISDVLEVTIKKMSEVMQAEICMLFLKDEQQERVVLKQVFGLPESFMADTYYDIGEGLTGEVARTREARLIGTAVENNGKYDAAIRAHMTATHGLPRTIMSLMAVPIQVRDQLVGVMKVINRVGTHLEYDERNLELFQTFADYVGVAIENAQIYKLTNERLMTAEKNSALSSLVSAVAHEINNTSGVIPANVDGLREYLGAANNPEVNQMLDVIEDAANQATDFANELAGFSANRRGQQKALNVNTVLRDAIEFLGKQYWETNKTVVEWSLTEEPLVCDIYRTPFVQIVRNIVINAVQALEGTKGARIRISSTKTTDGKEFAVLRFEDNGPGIKPEYWDRIFAPDFSTKPKGNGIGLWIARIQLETVGGAIEIDRNATEGATFIVRIPLSTHAESSQ